MSLYALQLPSGAFLSAYQMPGSDEDEYDFYSLSEAGSDDVPYLVTWSGAFTNWIDSCAAGIRPYDASVEPALMRAIARGRVVEVEVSVAAFVR